jgi:hypothetical protein
MHCGMCRTVSDCIARAHSAVHSILLGCFKPLHSCLHPECILARESISGPVSPRYATVQADAPPPPPQAATSQARSDVCIPR